MQKPYVEFDTEIDSYYIYVSDEPVYKTKAISQYINLDIDEEGFIVGIEALDLGVKLPFQKFSQEYAMSLEQQNKIKDLLKSIHKY